MKLYLYKTQDGKYLAEMETCVGDLRTVGAVNPETDGNYFKELHISAIKDSKKFVLGMKGWLHWFINEALPNKWAVISDEFPFDPKKIKIVEFREYSRKKKTLHK